MTIITPSAKDLRAMDADFDVDAIRADFQFCLKRSTASR